MSGLSACTADLDHPCDGGEDGDPCASCLEARAYYRASYDAASDEERRRVIGDDCLDELWVD